MFKKFLGREGGRLIWLCHHMVEPVAVDSMQYFSSVLRNRLIVHGHRVVRLHGKLVLTQHSVIFQYLI
uniref:Uncharacterized protein n=2 Tax=Anguilla anguilla TaxID=7936 RepID=A0A0E9TNI3_ANGAN